MAPIWVLPLMLLLFVDHTTCFISHTGVQAPFRKRTQAVTASSGLELQQTRKVQRAQIQLVRSLESCGRKENARGQTGPLRLWEEAKRSGLPLEDSLLYNAAVAACGRTGEENGALALLGLMRELGLRPNPMSHETALLIHARRGEPDRALDEVRALRKGGHEPCEMMWNALAIACARAGHHECIFEVLAEIRVLSQRPPPSVLNVAMLSTQSMDDLEGFERAMRLLAQMKDSGIVPTEAQVNIALDACRRTGHEVAALGLLLDMTTIEDGPSPSVLSFNLALMTFAEAGQQDWVQALLAEMRRQGLSPDLVSYTVALNNTSSLGLDTILALLKDMERDGVRPSLAVRDANMGGVEGPPPDKETIRRELHAQALAEKEQERRLRRMTNHIRTTLRGTGCAPVGATRPSITLEL